MKHTHETLTQLKAAYQLAEMNHNADPEHPVKKATFEKAKADFEQAEAGEDLEPDPTFEPLLVLNPLDTAGLDAIKADVEILLKLVQTSEEESKTLKGKNQALTEERQALQLENEQLKLENSLLKSKQIEKEEKQEEAPKSTAPAAVAPAATAPVVAAPAKPAKPAKAADEKKN